MDPVQVLPYCMAGTEDQGSSTAEYPAKLAGFRKEKFSGETWRENNHLNRAEGSGFRISGFGFRAEFGLRI